MKKHPLLVFIAIIAIMVGSVIWFIQSASFARFLKKVVAKHLPADIGVQGDFSELAVKLFPPGVSIKEPRITVSSRNILNLPPQSYVKAGEIQLNFLPFQVFSGTIRVHELKVKSGEIQLILPPSNDKASAAKKAGLKTFLPKLHWDELFQIRAESIALENCRVNVQSIEPKFEVDLDAQTIKLGQWSGRGGLGYELELGLDRIRSSVLAEAGLPEGLDRLNALIRVNALGAQIESITAAHEGVELQASGHITGNVQGLKNLALDGTISMKGDLARVSRLLQSRRTAKPPSRASAKTVPADAMELSGEVLLQARVKGSAERLAETLRAEGTLTGKDLGIGHWKFEQLSAEAGFTSENGGELSLTKAVLSSRERERSGGTQPGDGGRVEIGPARIPLSALESAAAPIEVPILLERAHIHWLGAGALKAVYPLDFRATGTVRAAFQPGARNRPWNLVSKLDLKIVGFSLDNQRLGKTKPLTRLIQVPEIKMVGQLKVDPKGLYPESVELSLPRTKLVLGGKIDFQEGYALDAKGEINLEDLGKLAETDIRGEGSLKVNVHGPAARVFLDFDADLKDAYYLRMKLGALKGRITWDDDPNQLLLTALELHKGGTDYSVDGKLDLGTADTVALRADLKKGNIQDLTGIFEDFTSDLWWFPASLTGPMQGVIKVAGGIRMDALTVSGDLIGSNWRFGGEEFRSVRLKGGYDRGSYVIEDVQATKQTGRLQGSLTYDKDHRFEWKLHTDEIPLKELNHLARLDVPIRGQLSIQSNGSGRDGAIRSATQVSITDLSIRGRPMAASRIAVSSEAGLTRMKAELLGGQGTCDLTYGFAAGTPSTLRGEFRKLDFSPGLLLLNPKSIQDSALMGTVSGSINVNFRSGELERATGSAELSEWMMARSDARFELERPVSIRASNGDFELNGAAIRGDAGRSVLNLRARGGQLEGGIEGDLDLAIARFFTPVIAGSTGAAALDFNVSGKVKEPLVTGKATFSGGSVKIASLESPLENLTGALAVRDWVLRVEDVEADLAGGKVNANGTIQLFSTKWPILALKSNMSGSKLKIFPFQFIKLYGSLKAEGAAPPYLVEGAFNVDSALSNEKIFKDRKLGPGTNVVAYSPTTSSGDEANMPLFRLKLDANAERGVMVQNELFDAELKGNITVVNTLEAPRIVGRAEMVQGKMLFKDRAFNVTAATLNFDNPAVINPAFSVQAQTDINQVKINLFATGRLDKPKVELSSNPVMSESDILSLLTVGFTSTDSRRLSVNDRSMIEQGQAASLLLNSLDFNRELQSKTGLEIQLDESYNQQVGNSIFRPQSGQDAVAPKVVIRRNFGKRVRLQYGSTVGVGQNSQRQVSAELRVTPVFSVIGVWDTFQTLDTLENQTSYGLDLKLQKRFK